MAAAVASPPETSIRGSSVPWITRVGTSNSAQRRGAVPRGEDRQQLPRRPIRVDAPVVARRARWREAPPRPDRTPATRSPSRSRTTNSANPSRSAGGLVSSAGSASGCGWPDRPIPGRRHDRRQRQHPLRMPDRQRLADHPALRGAHHVRRLDAQVIEQTRAVLRHVVERVARRARVPRGRRHHVRARPALDLRRAPHVAVVEPHDAEPARRRAARRAPRPSPSICTPSPMTSSIVGSAGSPNAS